MSTPSVVDHVMFTLGDSSRCITEAVELAVNGKQDSMDYALYNKYYTYVNIDMAGVRSTEDITSSTFYNVDDITREESDLKSRYHVNTIAYTCSFSKNMNMNPPREKRTGYALRMADTDLICIDIDINKELQPNDRHIIASKLLCYIMSLLPCPTMYDFTANGGVHLWVTNDVQDLISQCNKDSGIKVAHGDNFDIDLFIPLKTSKVSRGIILPYSVLLDVKGQEKTYKCYTMPLKPVSTLVSYTQLRDALLGKVFDLPIGQDFINAFNTGCMKSCVQSGVKATVDTDESIDQLLESIDKTTTLKMNKQLFDVLVEGIKGVTVHGWGGCSIKEQFGLFHLFTSMYACICDEVTEDDVEDALNDIEDNNNMTPKAKASWRRDRSACLRRHINEPTTNFTGLIKALTLYNREYYDEHVKELIAKADTSIPFELDTYTFANFNQQCNSMKTYDALYKALARCVAIHLGKGYIIRELNDDGNITYQSVNRAELQRSFNIDVTVELSEEDKQALRDKKKKIVDTAITSTYKLITSPTFRTYAKSYMCISMMSNDSNVLSLYRPPAVKTYKPELVKQWIDFYHSALYYNEPFDELLHSLAYKLRHCEFIEKFFINYGNGHNGKSFLTHCLSLIFPNYSNVSVQQEQIESDQFNAWLADNLLVWMEEAQTSNYQSKNLDQRIKQLTTRTISIRAMHKHTKSATNWALMGMNTNSKDLYGLVRGDEALLERLVILHFKDINNREYVDETCRRLARDDCFGYSLWYYLMYEHVIPSTFNPCRYHGEEKYKFIEDAKIKAGNSVMDWFIESHANVFEQKVTIKGVDYRIAHESAVTSSYDNYKRQHTTQKCIQRPKDTLLQWGLECVRTTIKVNGTPHTVRIYKITEEAYNALIERLTHHDDEEVDKEGFSMEGQSNFIASIELDLY